MNTPENVTELKENEVFVFGSNLNGNHAGGAARVAKEKFGAEEGIEEGLTGKCYAFPTLDENMRKRPMEKLMQSRDKLFTTAHALPEKTFWLTRVGLGIAGYRIEEIQPLFENSPENIIQPIWNI